MPETGTHNLATFADQSQPHTGLLVALWLDQETAPQLAVSRGEPADALHITLCYCGDVDDLGELAVARAIAAVEREVQWRSPLTGKVGGYGRFLASDSSDGKDVFYAAVDVPGLAEVRQCVATALMEAGCLPSSTHGFTPHITLAYLKPDADNPVDSLPPVGLAFTAVTIMAGSRRIDIPFSPAPLAMYAVRDAGERPKVHVYQPATFAEPPEWSPFLPVPGLYEHPIYGTLDYSAETYDRIVDQFKRGIYQDKLPVNAEHDIFTSGAVGWITDMRIAKSGAIEAKVEWNDRGKALIEGDRYLYVSAELMPTWIDPVDPSLVYQDVAVGLALTTHPYFKERVLPPLAASEAVITRHAGTPGEEVLMGETKPDEQQQPPAADKPADESPTTPTDVQQATDQIIAQLSEKLGDKAKISDPAVLAFVEKTARELAETRAESKRNKEQATQLAEQNAILQAQNRVKFFTDEVMGRGDGNGTAWVGDITEHVRMLCSLAEKHGPDSWELKQYVTSNRAHAEQIKASSLFSEIGTGRGADQSQMAYDKLAALAAERAKASGGKETFEKAFDAVLMSEHDLRAAYARERRRDS